MLKSGIINIWTCFALAILVSFEEGQIKRLTCDLPVVCTSYRDSGRRNLKPTQMLPIHPAAILIAPEAFGGHIRAAEIRANAGMLIAKYRKKTKIEGYGRLNALPHLLLQKCTLPSCWLIKHSLILSKRDVLTNKERAE